MKYINYLLYTTLILFITAGVAACSKDEHSKAKSKSSNAKPISVTMYKNPNCPCCGRWAAYMEENGFSVTQITVKTKDQLASINDKYGVPNRVRGCHTALIDGYVVEGLVPVEAINKLLKERPDAKGIAVPGMPAGAPGMRIRGNRTPVDVYLFNGKGQVTYFGKF